ncbi:MAG: hypothetical protein M3Y33_02045 [Actinomycetota bacterium]|nr:hypothetical protein [Actinomycetota bacterium]
MFVGDEVIVNASFWSAQARLANLAQGDWLTDASERAYDDGLAGLIEVGPLGDLRAVPKLVRVRFREPAGGDDRAVFAIRWEAAGPGGGLFPALDADITMVPAAGQTTRLTLAGVYRPPLAGLGAALDRAIMHRVATVTVRSLLSQAADAIADPRLSRTSSIAAGLPPLPGKCRSGHCGD